MTPRQTGWLLTLAALAASSLAGGLAYAWEHLQIQRARKALWEALADPEGEDTEHTLVPLTASQVTDWYLPAEDPIHQGWAYPGRVALKTRPDLHATARDLHKACQAHAEVTKFTLECAGQRWSCHVLETVAGDVFALRRADAFAEAPPRKPGGIVLRFPS